MQFVLKRTQKALHVDSFIQELSLAVKFSLPWKCMSRAKTLYSCCIFIWKNVCMSVQEYTVPFFCFQYCQFTEHLCTMVGTETTLVWAERRLIKMSPWVRISLLDNYVFFPAFDVFMYCDFMVSCNRKFKS